MRDRGARGSRGRGTGRTAIRLLGAAILAAALPATAGEEGSGSASPGVDLLGTWFVVVHFTDVATANPEADRWEDRVWVFEEKGSRILWTEYPIVVFDDRSGRFESRQGNTRARTLSRWMPNEAQLAEIAAGPRVNSRGAKSKTLRADPDGDLQSMGALRAQAAMTIGYHESWSIASPDSLPVFSREDVMGTGRPTRAGDADQAIEGLTRYTTREVVDPDTLRGSYQRDEYRRGEFVMMRAGDVQGLESDGRSPNEKAADRAREAYEAEVRRRVQEGDPEVLRELRESRRNDR